MKKGIFHEVVVVVVVANVRERLGPEKGLPGFQLSIRCF